MELSNFITKVLTDIENGILNAKNITGKSYYVDLGNKSGVNFDIAVTTNDTTSSSVDAKANAGIIQVLGAGIGATIEEKSENNKISRIQFLIVVPNKTDSQIQRDMTESRRINEENRNSYY